MTDVQKVIKGLNDIGGFIAGRVGFEQARNFLRTIDDAISLLKEQEMRECCLCKHYDSVYKHCTYHDHDVEESEYCSRWVK